MKRLGILSAVGILTTCLLAAGQVGQRKGGKPGGSEGGGGGSSTLLSTDHHPTGSIDPDGGPTYTNDNAGITIELDRGRYEFTMQCTESSPCYRYFVLNLVELSDCSNVDQGDGIFNDLGATVRLSLFIEDFDGSPSTARAQMRVMDEALGGGYFSSGYVYTFTWDAVAVTDGITHSASDATMQFGSRKNSPSCTVVADFALTATPAQ